MASRRAAALLLLLLLVCAAAVVVGAQEERDASNSDDDDADGSGGQDLEAIVPNMDADSQGGASVEQVALAQQRALETARCKGTRGEWCVAFHRQLLVPVKPPPSHDTRCPNDCSGVGNCLADIGFCDCPAGE